MSVKTDNPNMGRPVKNKYKVPASVWKNWTNTARRTYNALYAEMRENRQYSLLPMDMPPLSRTDWREFRETFCVLAAEAANGSL